MSAPCSRFLLSLSVVVLASAGCETVESDHSTSAEFQVADHKTYRLLSPKVGESNRLTSAVQPRLRNGLSAKGYEETTQNPELIVSWKVLVDGQLGTQSGQPDNAQEAALSMGNYAGGTLVGSASTLGSPAEKTLIVFVQEAATHEVHWVGWAQADVSDATLVERTVESVDRLLKTLPSRKKS